MTDRKVMLQIIFALEWNLPVIEDYGDKEQLDLQHKAINLLRDKMAQLDPAQVSPLEFVEAAFEKEHLVGKPLMWAQWPNEEKK